MGLSLPPKSLCEAVLWLLEGWESSFLVGAAWLCEFVCACALYRPAVLNVGFVLFGDNVNHLFKFCILRDKVILTLL